MAKKILVTGGAGFLGSHLCDRLLARGDKVICVDNLYTGSTENIAHLEKNDNFEFIRHDVRRPFVVGKLDEIYNLACPASPPHYQKDPIFTMETSISGALNALQIAKYTGAKILQASTSEVYGDPEVHPQPETYKGSVNPIGIRACYDEGKRAAETLFFDFHRFHGVKIAVMRIFNTYGPRMDPQDGRVVSNFILQALRGSDLTVYGQGTQTRSFCFVDDLIDGMIALMEGDTVGPVNIGNPCEFTILELAEKVIKLTKSTSKIVFHALPSDDPKQRKPVIERAKTLLGWEPKISLEEGLKKTIPYFKQFV